MNIMYPSAPITSALVTLASNDDCVMFVSVRNFVTLILFACSFSAGHLPFLRSLMLSSPLPPSSPPPPPLRRLRGISCRYYESTVFLKSTLRALHPVTMDRARFQTKDNLLSLLINDADTSRSECAARDTTACIKTGTQRGGK